jgi:malate/lactate dehydrogenase
MAPLTLGPTQTGHWFSSAIATQNNPYGIDEDLIFSFPCTTSTQGVISVMPGLDISSYLENKIKASEKELQEERDLVKTLLRPGGRQ